MCLEKRSYEEVKKVRQTLHYNELQDIVVPFSFISQKKWKLQVTGIFCNYQTKDPSIVLTEFDSFSKRERDKKKLKL